MSDLVPQIIAGVITTILAVFIISLREILVLRPIEYLWRWTMRMRCKVFKKHSMKFLIGLGDQNGGKSRYTCKFCTYTVSERW